MEKTYQDNKNLHRHLDQKKLHEEKPYVDSKRNIWAREICKQNLNAKENIYFIEKPQVGKRKGIL
jgi:gluconate kinase